MRHSPRPRILPAVWLLAAAVATTGAFAHEAHRHEPERHDPPAVTASPLELVERFRQSGDDRHLEAAWKSITPALERPDTATAERLLEAAFVAQALHRFDTALALTDRALAHNAGNDQAWLLRASIALVRGDTKAARAACRRLTRAAVVVIAACHARGTEEVRQQRLSLQRLDALLATPAAAHLAPRVRAWVLSVAGDLAAGLADTAAAVERYSASLALAERAQVRSALVDVLLRAGRLRRAEAVLSEGSAALPLTIRRYIVARRQGRFDDVRADVAATDREFRRWIDAGDWLHAREMARFYLDVLDDPALAGRLARANLAVQREPEDRLLAQRTGH
ncbi:MAG: hypothetical protein AAFX58_01155 [Pseudomonadota bacterium]